MLLQLEALQFYVGSSLSGPNETSNVNIDEFYDNVSLPRDALVHSAVLRLHVVRLSVRLSVCL